jgi:RimJ/RimL family protein N-acetyltransferase
MSDSSPATGSEPLIVGSILIGADQMVAELVRSRIPHMSNGTFGPCVALGVIRRGVLVGGVVFHDFRGFDVMMSGAFDAPGWALPGTIRALCAYPFLDLGCRRVTSITGKRNKKARRFNEKLGFTLEGIVRHGLDGVEHACLYGMLKEDCRWLKGRENGKLGTGTTAAA